MVFIQIYAGIIYKWGSVRQAVMRYKVDLKSTKPNSYKAVKTSR